MKVDELYIKTQACIASKDGSYEECYGSESEAKNARANLVNLINSHDDEWDMINSDAKAWGRNGMEHIASETAKGHMGDSKDNFRKKMERFYALVNHLKNMKEAYESNR